MHLFGSKLSAHPAAPLLKGYSVAAEPLPPPPPEDDTSLPPSPEDTIPPLPTPTGPVEPPPPPPESETEVTIPPGTDNETSPGQAPPVRVLIFQFNRGCANPDRFPCGRCGRGGQACCGNSLPSPVSTASLSPHRCGNSLPFSPVSTASLPLWQQPPFLPTAVPLSRCSWDTSTFYPV